MLSRARFQQSDECVLVDVHVADRTDRDLRARVCVCLQPLADRQFAVV